MQTQPIGASAPAVFNFSPSFSVRIVTREGEPWFVAKDIAEALDYKWKGIATISHTPEEWRGVYSVQTPQINQHGTAGEQTQELIVLSEQGVYFFLGRSDKPKSLPFQKWLAGEVLPAIRKTGRYVAPTAPEPEPEQISTNDYRNLQRVLWMIVDRFHFRGGWTAAIWAAMRQVTGCAAPNRFNVRHLPVIAAELRRILEISEAVRAHCREMEKEAIRRVVQNREAAAPFVALLQAEEARWLNEARPWQAQICVWSQKDLDAVALRHPAVGSDHSNYAEPKTLAAAI